MKVSVTGGDMRIVGYNDGKRQLCTKCAEKLNVDLCNPLFAKTAREYKLSCSLCGETF